MESIDRIVKRFTIAYFFIWVAIWIGITIIVPDVSTMDVAVSIVTMIIGYPACLAALSIIMWHTMDRNKLVDAMSSQPAFERREFLVEDTGPAFGSYRGTELYEWITTKDVKSNVVKTFFYVAVAMFDSDGNLSNGSCGTDKLVYEGVLYESKPV